MLARAAGILASTLIAVACSSGGGGGGAFDGGADSGTGGQTTTGGAGGATGGAGGATGGAGGATGGGAGTGGATVSGMIQLVNAPGSAAPSVILVPDVSFDANRVHSTLPSGPSTTMQPSGQWSITNVPAGAYRVLVSFENDGLVMDPESAIQLVSVSGTTVDAGTTKVTSALEIVSPDAEATVSGTPSFEWNDTLTEQGYQIEVVDELGQVVWQSTLPADMTSTAYGGPQLSSGALYQWRLTAVAGGYPITRSEDLRGTFRPL